MLRFGKRPVIVEEEPESHVSYGVYIIFGLGAFALLVSAIIEWFV